MVSREQKRTALYEKLQILRSVTNSSAVDKTSIIVDASKYIEDLKQRVERLNGEMVVASSESSSSHSSLPVQVEVEIVDRGFLINVFSEKNRPGLLVSVLEAFDELGLDVLDARVSCTDSFHLEAVGGENQGSADMDAQAVKQAVLQAIDNCTQGYSNLDAQK